MFEETIELIYEVIATRIKTKKDILKLTNKEIITYGDDALVSHIIKNKRLSNKNPYLIPKGKVADIVDNLKFDSEKDLLWGTDEEIKHYLKYFFLLLITEALEGTFLSESEKKVIDNKLRDYLPYALTAFYYEQKNGDLENFTFLGTVLSTRFSCSIEEVAENRTAAIGRLFIFNEDFFFEEMKSFTERAKDITKIDRILLNFLREKILPIFERIQAKYYDKLEQYFKDYSTIIGKGESQLLDLDYYHDSYEIIKRDTDNAFLKIDEIYISQLINIQKKEDCLVYEELTGEPLYSYELLLKNHWNENYYRSTICQ